MGSGSARNLLKGAALALGERTILFPWAVNVVGFVMGFLTSLPDRYRDRRQDYAAETGLIGSGAANAYADHETNFVAWLLMNGHYAYVIELGALTLARGRALSSVFPAIKFNCLDVTLDFAEERQVGAVTVGPNNRAQIEKIVRANSGQGIICARGTLCYYTQDDLRELFADAFSHGADIAVSEPTTRAEGALSGSWRRTEKTFYHPYRRLLREVGFELPDGAGGAANWVNISGFGELRNFIYARHPTDVVGDHPTTPL
jgi:hypothetical protein